MNFDAMVIGGGINGLCAAYHLKRLGLGRVAVVERFAIGHDRGSSHGEARITRSTYANADYVRLMQHVHAEEWPRLERDLAAPLIHRTPGCFFGPPGRSFEDYRMAVQIAEADVVSLDRAEARRQFPQFTFDDSQVVLVDRTAGLIAAAHAIAGLRRWLLQNGVELLENRRVAAIESRSSHVAVICDEGSFETERLALAAGAWIGDLAPFLKPRLTVVRQTVGYFRLAGPAGRYRCGQFPVWCYLHDAPERFFYGLPEFGALGSGIKFARHRTQGQADDPDGPSGDFAAELAVLQSFAAAQFNAPIESTVHVEACLYTNTVNEDFLIDFHPADGRIAFASACSGHGFKFGPLTGRALAEMLVHGAAQLPAFAAIQDRFHFRPAH